MNLVRNKVAVFIYKVMIKTMHKLQQWPRNITPAPFRLIQIGSSFWQSRALYVATKLEVADVLGDDTVSITTIANKLDLHESHLYRLMRMLASIGVFKETSPNQFKNSKLSQYLRKNHQHSVQAMILMHNSPEMTMPWLSSRLIRN